jgi:16S rRNA G966 N2-methylase RsmD
MWPWFSYACIFYLERFDLSTCRVLEFGAGGSTLFWAASAKEVISLETDHKWFEAISKNKPRNVRLTLHEKDDFEKCLAQLIKEAPFDIVVIDGAWRTACAIHCKDLVKDTGMVILDNPDWYPTAHENMKGNSLIEVSFSGLTPIQAYSTTTNIYFSRKFAIPFKKSFKFKDIPGSIPDNHEN